MRVGEAGDALARRAVLREAERLHAVVVDLTRREARGLVTLFHTDEVAAGLSRAAALARGIAR